MYCFWVLKLMVMHAKHAGSLILIFSVCTAHTIVFGTVCKDNYDVHLLQTIVQEGFHRRIDWLLETRNTQLQIAINVLACKLSFQLEIPSSLYVSNEELKSLNWSKVAFLTHAADDPEAMTHMAQSVTLKLFHLPRHVDNTYSIQLPIHLRYHKCKTAGGSARIVVERPALFVRCSANNGITIRRSALEELSNQVLCKTTHSQQQMYTWKRIWYTHSFNETELLIPVGNLDDYVTVSILTVIVSCVGFMYILSVLFMGVEIYGDV